MIYHLSNIATIRYGALKLYTFILYQIWVGNIKSSLSNYNKSFSRIEFIRGTIGNKPTIPIYTF